MKKTKVLRGASQRYLNALWHLYSKAEPVHNMNKVSSYFQIASTFGTIATKYNYVKKIDGQYVYAKYDAPTMHDAKFILNKIRILKKEQEAERYNTRHGNQLNLKYAQCTEVNPDIKSLPQPVVKKIAKKKKEPNVWMYIAVISMFTTLVTMALVLLR